MNIADYFEPVNTKNLRFNGANHPFVLLNHVAIHKSETAFPALDKADIALIGVKEDRNAPENKGCALAPDDVRKYLYKLFRGPYKIRIADLGNIAAGESVKDTYFAVRSVVTNLLDNNITPLIIGGSQDLTYANYQAYEIRGQIINLVSVDARFDIGVKKDEIISNTNFLSSILISKPNYLFNYTNIGYQTFFVDQDAIDLMDKLYFDVYRLGDVRNNLAEVEPIVRNADMVSFDISSIRKADAPGNALAPPMGLHGEEACQITRYAGLSDKLSSIGFYELNPAFDNAHQTAHLLAQMIWYFIDGYYHRKHDFPNTKIKDSDVFIKYAVSIKDFQNIINFYKSKKSDRWWMEVPCPVKLQKKYDRQLLVPCSFNDYREACQNNIPEKWWQVYQKFV